MPKQVGVSTYPSAGITGSVGTPSPPSALVSGAGTSAANGTYTVRGTTNGKPYYNLAGQPNSVLNFVVNWTGTQWVITDGAADTLYESNDVVAFPWQTITWVANVGDAPVPTVRMG